MSNEYISALLGIGGTILGFVLSEISTNIKREKDEKERFIMANYTQRQQAYSKIYSSLITYQSYFYKIIDYGNEYVEHIEANEFGPLSELTIIRQIFDENQIWLHNKTIEDFHELFNQSSSACNIALYIALGDNQDMWTSQVESISRNLIKTIEKIKEHIRELTGMKLLDGYQIKFYNQ